MGWQGKKPTFFTETVKKDIENAMGNLTLVLVSSLTLYTPVDTGRARSNWIVTTGTPTDEVSDVQDTSGSPSITSATNVTPKMGQVIYINNNLPYIGYLNNGTDKMQAYNMVPRAIATAKRVYR